MIQYIENTNLAYCDGHRFVKEKSGYWQCSAIHKRLHTYIYEKYNGEIPKGMQVHHIDHNKDNNEIDNLQLLTREEHNKIHYAEMNEEEKERRRKNLELNARPKAIEWHKSEKGKDWHLKHYEKIKSKLHVIHNFICIECGKQFESEQTRSKFCSNKCKSKYRRKNKLDEITKKCIICGNIFTANKYRQAKTCSRKCAGILRKDNKNYV